MNCAELQQDLPDIRDSVYTTEQEEHLRVCSVCSELLSEIDFIVQQAQLLQDHDLEEPSPLLWNAIEATLRREGVIREPKRELTIVHRSAPRRSRAWWLLPATAALLAGFGLVRYERATGHPPIAQSSAPNVASLQPVAALNAPKRFSAADDARLLEVVSSRLPAMRASYESDLQNVNAYIRDAEESARSNPNDEENQQYLMNAYEQKAMVYDMALNRSVP